MHLTTGLRRPISCHTHLTTMKRKNTPGPLSWRAARAQGNGAVWAPSFSQLDRQVASPASCPHVAPSRTLGLLGTSRETRPWAGSRHREAPTEHRQSDRGSQADKPRRARRGRGWKGCWSRRPSAVCRRCAKHPGGALPAGRHEPLERSPRRRAVVPPRRAGVRGTRTSLGHTTSQVRLSPDPMGHSPSPPPKPKLFSMLWRTS